MNECQQKLTSYIVLDIICRQSMHTDVRIHRRTHNKLTSM